MKTKAKAKFRELSARELRAVNGGLVEGPFSDPGGVQPSFSKLEGGGEKPATVTT